MSDAAVAGVIAPVAAHLLGPAALGRRRPARAVVHRTGVLLGRRVAGDIMIVNHERFGKTGRDEFGGGLGI